MLRDTDKLLWPAVCETIAVLKLDPDGQDAAAAKLAQRYAQVIDALPDKAVRGEPDQAWGMRWVGPLLLDALNALGATPAARAAIAKGAKTGPGEEPADVLAHLKPRRRGA